MRPSAVPVYNITDAARFIKTEPEDLRRWFEGYEAGGRYYPPVLAAPTERPLGRIALSFENLIEAASLVIFRTQRISLSNVK